MEEFSNIGFFSQIPEMKCAILQGFIKNLELHKKLKLAGLNLNKNPTLVEPKSFNFVGWERWAE